MTNHEPQPQAGLNILASIDQAATGIRGAKESIQGIGKWIVPHCQRPFKIPHRRPRNFPGHGH
jgi:hypothetical protein